MIAQFRNTLTVCAVFLIGYTTWAVDTEDLPSITQLQREYVASNGGLANMMDLTSIIASGEVTDDQGNVRDFKLFLKRPDFMRIQVELGDSQFRKVFNGSKGYEISEHFSGEVKSVPITGDDLEALSTEAGLDGLFFKLRSRPELMTVVGLTEVNGEPAYEVLIDEAMDSNYDRVWLHKDHFQELKLSRTIANEEGGSIHEEVLMTDFVQVRGVWSPKRIQYYTDGQLARMIEITSIRSNVGLFDSLFEKPKS